MKDAAERVKCPECKEIMKRTRETRWSVRYECEKCRKVFKVSKDTQTLEPIYGPF